MGVGVFASCERLRHLTKQLTAACSYRGARMPPAGLRPERARRINSIRVFITHVQPRRRQPATSPDANEPVLASRRPSISACLSSLPPPSRQPTVPPSYSQTTHSSSVLSNFFSPFALFLCPLRPGTTTRGFTSRYVLVYTQANSL